MIILELEPIEGRHVVEHPPSPVGRDPRRVRQKQHRVLPRTETDPLIPRRQEAGAPHPFVQRLRIGVPARPGDHHHVGGKVVVLGTQSVREPRPQRRPPGDLVPRLQQGHRRIVVDRFGEERTDQADSIGDPRRVRQQLAQPDARVAMLCEAKDRRRHRKPRLAGGHPRQALAAADRGRQIFVESRFEMGFVIEQIELRRSAGLREPDHPPRLGRKMRKFRQSVVRQLSRAACVALQQRGESRDADADRAVPQKQPAVQLALEVERKHRIVLYGSTLW